MNFLFLYRIYPSYGGVEVITTLLANEFVKDGHNVSIASFEQGKDGLLKQLDKRVKLLKLDRKVLSPKNIKSLKEWCTIHKIDIILNQWGLPFYTSLLLKLAVPKCILVSVLHGSPVVAKTLLHTQGQMARTKNYITKNIYKCILFFKRQIMRYGLRYNLKVNKKYILLSNAFIPTFKKFTGIDNCPKLMAIGNPVTIKTDYDCHLSEKQKILLYVGRMDYENKRVDRVIDFWERCHNLLPDWELIMVGDGPHKQYVEIKAKSLPRVTLSPFQEEPPIEYYKKASILLLTSDLEGFGLVVIEAMSYGVVPVVYGSYEAIFDIINNGVDGNITNTPFSEYEFDLVVRKLCDNDSIRQSFAKNAVEKSKIFSIELIKEKFYSVFSEVLDFN